LKYLFPFRVQGSRFRVSGWTLFNSSQDFEVFIPVISRFMILWLKIAVLKEGAILYWRKA